MEVGKELTEDMWQAIVKNDATYDDKMIYALKTTGIFCKPSCKSRMPNKVNVSIFNNVKEALSANFRPCKRCNPTKERLPDHEWVDEITKYIEANYNESLRLQTIAYMCHGSPYHMHRTFKRIKGITPASYIQQLRINKAAEFLIHTDRNIADIAIKVGIPSTTYFVTLFKKISGFTPKDYRQINRNYKDVL
ncbi:bifunctional transcriptional activator/DNA repair enzyme AdaA [Salipaludibacillus sp. HK11]|uniref:bifunctional transcriptional activator/DNA repair enzyme AdaA n=1 Tax=Salipaludibacillus sp. HK11 TaxID=3394320 RepID=UPI0039FB9E95